MIVVKQSSRKRRTPTGAGILLDAEPDVPALPELARTSSVGNELIVCLPDPLLEANFERDQLRVRIPGAAKNLRFIPLREEKAFTRPRQ